METPLVIEILDRFGRVREKHKLTHFPIRMGRAYDNDIILDDPYVSPVHIELRQDDNGHTTVVDLNSENGLFSLHPIKRHDTLELDDNLRIRIGHTDIRIRSPKFAIRETFIDRVWPSRLHLLLTNMVMLPIAWFLVASVLLAYNFEQSYQTVTFSSLIAPILPIFIFIFAWSCIWSIVSKIVTHKFYFSYHTILTSLVVIGFYLIEPLYNYIEYIYPINGLANYLSLMTDVALPTLLLYGNLRQSTPLGRRRTLLAAFVTSSLVVGVIQLTAFVNQPEFNGQPQFSQILKAPMFNPHHGQSIDQFLTHTQSLGQFAIKRDHDDSGKTH